MEFITDVLSSAIRIVLFESEFPHSAHDTKTNLYVEYQILQHNILYTSFIFNQQASRFNLFNSIYCNKI